MLNRLKKWLFPTTFEVFDFDAIDRDKDGIVQEGTPFERKLANSVAKKPAKKAVKKKAVAKKAPAKKTVKKKAVSKKTAPKKTKKATKKK